MHEWIRTQWGTAPLRVVCAPLVREGDASQVVYPGQEGMFALEGCCYLHLRVFAKTGVIDACARRRMQVYEEAARRKGLSWAA